MPPTEPPPPVGVHMLHHHPSDRQFFLLPLLCLAPTVGAWLSYCSCEWHNQKSTICIHLSFSLLGRHMFWSLLKKLMESACFVFYWRWLDLILNTAHHTIVTIHSSHSMCFCHLPCTSQAPQWSPQRHAQWCRNFTSHWLMTKCVWSDVTHSPAGCSLIEQYVSLEVKLGYSGCLYLAYVV